MVTILYNIIKYAVYLSLFTPLIVHKSFLFPFVVPKTIFFWATAEVIFFAWVLLAVFDKSFRPRKNLLVFAVMIFLLVMLMASFRGVNWSQSMWGPIERMGGFITFAHLAAYFLALSFTFSPLINTNITANRNEWRRILGVSIFVGVLVAGFFILGYFGGDNVWIYARQGSTLGNSSLMGSYLMFPVFISLYLFLSQKVPAKALKILYSLTFLFLSFVLFRSTAWGAFLSFVIGLFLIFIFYFWYNPRMMGNPRMAADNLLGFAQNLLTAVVCRWHQVFAVILFILLITVSLAAFFGLFWQSEIILGYLPDIFSSPGVKATIYGRLTVWKIAWHGFKERPILGWGPENFIEAFSHHYNPCLGLARKCGGEILYDRAHNTVFDMMVFGGLAGLGAYLWIFGAAFYILFKKLWKLMETNGNLLPTAAIGALLVGYFVQNLMVFDMIGSYQMFFLTLAFVASYYNRNLETWKLIET